MRPRNPRRIARIRKYISNPRGASPVVVAGILVAILCLPPLARGPKIKFWGNVVEVAAPTALTNWDTTGANSTTVHYLSITINSVDENILLDFTQKDPLKHKQTDETLTTTWTWWTDGNGTTTTGVITGGSYGGTPYANQGQATGSTDTTHFVTSSALMNPGVVVTQIPPDETVILYIKSRGKNAQDYGSNSDATEVPDAGTNYEAAMEIRLTY